MNQPLPIKIAGIGRYLPQRVVTNAEVEEMCGLPLGTIDQTAAGVKERRWIQGEESNSYMGAQAALEAMEEAGMTIRDIDLILNASGTQERVIPDGSTLIQRQLGMADSGLPCMSIHSTCLSFLWAFNVAAHFIQSGQYRNILIVSSDVGSRNINPSEPESFVLFGDAGAAVVVTRPGEGEKSCMSRYIFRTFSEGADFTRVLTGTARPPHLPDARIEDSLFHMEGKQLYKLTKKYGPESLEMLRPGLSRGLGDIRLVVPHQASGLAIRAYAKHNKWPMEKIAVTIDWLGNTIAASIPATLYDVIRQGRIERGDEVLLVGTGAGLSLGGAVITY